MYITQCIVGSNNKYKECSVDRRLVNYTSYHIISGECNALTINIFLPVQVSSGLFNTTYAIPRATTIPADSTEHKVRRVSVCINLKFCMYIDIVRYGRYLTVQQALYNSNPSEYLKYNELYFVSCNQWYEMHITLHYITCLRIFNHFIHTHTHTHTVYR